ncbi:hypothetical protein BH24ACT5_BH24ACT5_09210 [soil metagenome]
MNANRILITGGTGKVGSRLSTRPDRHGISTRIGSRRGQPPFDWTDSMTWGLALDGCDAAFVAYAPDIGFPGADHYIGEFAVAASG